MEEDKNIQASTFALDFMLEIQVGLDLWRSVHDAVFLE